MDADSWKKREEKFKKKFDTGKKYIRQLFKGFTLSSEIEQIAVFVLASKVTHQTIGGGKIQLISELLPEIFSELKSTHISTNAVSENQPILRSFQFVSDNWAIIDHIMVEKGGNNG